MVNFIKIKGYHESDVLFVYNKKQISYNKMKLVDTNLERQVIL